MAMAAGRHKLQLTKIVSATPNQKPNDKEVMAGFGWAMHAPARYWPLLRTGSFETTC